MIRMFKAMKASLHLHLDKIFFYTLVVLCLLCFYTDYVQQALGSQSANEPYVSLKAENLPLDRVLNKLAQDTGLNFQINHQWKTYPVNASIEAQPLHQALKQILRGLNHAIIYERDKSIKIVVYGRIEPQDKNPNFVRHSTFPMQRDKPETGPLRDPDSEESAELKDEDESSEESGPSEKTDNENTQNETIPKVREADKEASEE